MRSQFWLTILKCCVALTVFARGWLTWRWDSPIRALIWNEGWWGKMIDWETFATESDSAITQSLMLMGLCLMVGAIVPLLCTLKPFRWTAWLLIPLAILLFIDAFARFVDSSYQIGMAIEHSLQWICPILLFSAARPELIPGTKWKLAAGLATIATFVGHGLYAIGFHPVPLTYQAMTTSIFKLTAVGAFLFLKIAGILDFVASISLIIPQFRKLALIYMMIWGFLTAAARVAYGAALDPWLLETVVRSSHWMIPLVIFLIPHQTDDIEIATT